MNLDSRIDLFNSDLRSAFSTLFMFPFFGKYSGEHGLNNTNVQKFIHRNDLHFDLIINEEIYHDSWLMFGHKFNAPIVTICEYLNGL